MAGKKFLQRVSLKDARRIAAAASRPTGAEPVPTDNAFARVTAEPVYAAFSAPHYRASAMDGIAVRAADTAPNVTNSVRLRRTTRVA
jgi:putative molybdopterin biosynthesis protein